MIILTTKQVSNILEIPFNKIDYYFRFKSSNNVTRNAIGNYVTEDIARAMAVHLQHYSPHPLDILLQKIDNYYE